MKKIALIGEMHEDGLKVLDQFECKIIDLTNLEKNEIIENIRDADGIALRTSLLDGHMLKNCQSLKIISRHGVGYDNVDLNYLNKNNIALAVTGTSNAVTVAEHVMTMFLILSKMMVTSDKIVKSNKWEDKRQMGDFFELYQKNILILGFGRIGKQLAKRCHGFDSNVFVFDPYVEGDEIKESNCMPISFDEGLRIADYISVHMPLNDETRNIISEKEISMMKNNCILINTARGGIINEKDLFQALNNKTIHGAGLDVYEKEPPDNNHPLFQLDNIILTPHNAALTLECRKRMAIETCENIVYYLFDREKLNDKNIINRNNLNL